MFTSHTVFFFYLPLEEVTITNTEALEVEALEVGFVYLEPVAVFILSLSKGRSACTELSRSGESEGVCLPLESERKNPTPLRGSWRGFLFPLRWSLSLPNVGSWRGCKTYLDQNSSAFLDLPFLGPTHQFHQQLGPPCTTLPQRVLNCASLNLNPPHHPKSLDTGILPNVFYFLYPLERAGVRPMPGLRLQHQQDVFLSTPKIILPARCAGRTVATRDSVVLLLRTAQRGKPRNSAFHLLETCCT